MPLSERDYTKGDEPYDERVKIDDEPPVRVVAVDYRQPPSDYTAKAEGWVFIIMVVLAALKGIKVL